MSDENADRFFLCREKSIDIFFISTYRPQKSIQHHLTGTQISKSKSPASTMYLFKKKATQQPIAETDRARVEREGHEISKKLLEHFCAHVGFLPQDVQPYLQGYQARRKIWKNMNMRTIYREFNDPELLPTIVWLDCRMSDEEMAKIDRMDMNTLVTFIQKESRKKFRAFVRASPTEDLELKYLKEKAKYCLRLTVDEIAAKETFVDMARYWCHVRPESWGAGTRDGLMRLFKGVE